MLSAEFVRLARSRSDSTQPDRASRESRTIETFEQAAMAVLGRSVGTAVALLRSAELIAIGVVLLVLAAQHVEPLVPAGVLHDVNVTLRIGNLAGSLVERLPVLSPGSGGSVANGGGNSTGKDDGSNDVSLTFTVTVHAMLMMALSAVLMPAAAIGARGLTYSPMLLMRLLLLLLFTCTGAAAAAVFIGTFVYGSVPRRGSPAFPAPTDVWLPDNTSGVNAAGRLAFALGILFFAFSAHVFMPTMARSDDIVVGGSEVRHGRPRTHGGVAPLARRAFFYAVVGTSGYLVFGRGVDGVLSTSLIKRHGAHSATALHALWAVAIGATAMLALVQMRACEQLGELRRRGRRSGTVLGVGVTYDVFKVFVGNLAFKTKTEELKIHFAAAGDVLEAQLIRRQGRSLGFGFVSFANKGEADLAIELFNQKELEGRVLNVELAQSKPHVAAEGTAAAAEGGAEAKKARRPRKKNAGGDGNKTAPAGGAAPEAASGATTDGATTDGEGAKKPRKPRTRKPKAAKAAAAEGGADGAAAAAGAAGSKSEGEGAGAGEKPKRAPRAPRAPRVHEGEPSKTTIFVGNLPFKVTDADLALIFKDYAVKAAHVVKSKFGRSKGYGFLEMESPEAQAKVLEDVKNATVEDRQLVSLLRQKPSSFSAALPLPSKPAALKPDAPAAGTAADPSDTTASAVAHTPHARRLVRVRSFAGTYVKMDTSIGVLDASLLTHHTLDGHALVLTMKPAGAPAPPPPAASRYRTEFEELERLGRGGFGVVYRARNLLDGQDYAIKKVKLNCSSDSSGDIIAAIEQDSLASAAGSGAMPSSVRGHNRKLSQSDNRLLREVKTFAFLSNHPNVVRYYNAWIEPASTDSAAAASSRASLAAEAGEAFLDSVRKTRFASGSSQPQQKQVARCRSQSFDLGAFSKPRMRPLGSGITHSRSVGSSLGSCFILPDSPAGSPLASKSASIQRTDSPAPASDAGSDSESDADGAAPDASRSASVNSESPSYRLGSLDVHEDPDVSNIEFARDPALGDSADAADDDDEAGNGIHAHHAATSDDDNVDSSDDDGDDGSDMDDDDDDDDVEPQAHHATLYIQMQLYPSQDLRIWLKSRKHVDRAQNLHIFTQIVSGLIHIHAQNVIHRDVKPENIFLHENHVYLGDFGLAKNVAEHVIVMDEAETASTEAIESSTNQGTYLYTAPEIIDSQLCTTKSDVYSLGIVLFELLNIFETGMERIVTLDALKRDAVIPSKLVEEFPEECRLIRSMISRDPSQRPSAADIVVNDLLRLDSLLPSSMFFSHWPGASGPEMLATPCNQLYGAELDEASGGSYFAAPAAASLTPGQSSGTPSPFGRSYMVESDMLGLGSPMSMPAGGFYYSLRRSNADSASASRAAAAAASAAASAAVSATAAMLSSPRFAGSLQPQLQTHGLVQSQSQSSGMQPQHSMLLSPTAVASTLPAAHGFAGIAPQMHAFARRASIHQMQALALQHMEPMQSPRHVHTLPRKSSGVQLPPHPPHSHKRNMSHEAFRWDSAVTTPRQDGRRLECVQPLDLTALQLDMPPLSGRAAADRSNPAESVCHHHLAACRTCGSAEQHAMHGCSTLLASIDKAAASVAAPGDTDLHPADDRDTDATLTRSHTDSSRKSKSSLDSATSALSIASAVSGNTAIAAGLDAMDGGQASTPPMAIPMRASGPSRRGRIGTDTPRSPSASSLPAVLSRASGGVSAIARSLVHHKDLQTGALQVTCGEEVRKSLFQGGGGGGGAANHVHTEQCFSTSACVAGPPRAAGRMLSPSSGSESDLDISSLSSDTDDDDGDVDCSDDDAARRFGSSSLSPEIFVVDVDDDGCVPAVGGHAADAITGPSGLDLALEHERAAGSVDSNSSFASLSVAAFERVPSDVVGAPQPEQADSAQVARLKARISDLEEMLRAAEDRAARLEAELRRCPNHSVQDKQALVRDHEPCDTAPAAETSAVVDAHKAGVARTVLAHAAASVVSAPRQQQHQHIRPRQSASRFGDASGTSPTKHSHHFRHHHHHQQPHHHHGFYADYSPSSRGF
ncbi:hypothetical protein HK105_204295 [Polyrhizophydium stewartii]|uniref:non-specific serine/threonine protein kinase n=1 Tax=Polyrhizophydium stewartii TaxID=2732419 RepID=A0ABR4N9T4_9FUNG